MSKKELWVPKAFTNKQSSKSFCQTLVFQSSMWISNEMLFASDSFRWQIVSHQICHFDLLLNGYRWSTAQLYAHSQKWNKWNNFLLNSFQLLYCAIEQTFNKKRLQQILFVGINKFRSKIISVKVSIYIFQFKSISNVGRVTNNILWLTIAWYISLTCKFNFCIVCCRNNSNIFWSKWWT